MLKFAPLSLFLAVGTKGLLQSFTLTDVIALAISGTLFFLYEINIQNKKLDAFKKQIQADKEELEKHIKDLDGMRSYLQGLKLNGMRPQNGFNRTAQ